MKKFYYKKEISLDKTPIILRLERRRTVNVAKDAGQEEQGRLSTRATSISGLDQLRYDPSLPRTRSREVTKSLSEDVLSSSSSYSTPSAVVITEAELSSSWLYKNMKAVANSREETENKTDTSSAPTPQEQDLTPKVLHDPKMKPIPVPVVGRSKKASHCCCYLAIMVIISLCTIGFLSTIGGILYMELISNDNLTTYPADDAIDVVQSLHNAPLQDLEKITEVDDQAETDYSFEEVQPEIDNRNNTEDDQQKTIHILDFGKPLGAELSQYIDNTRTQIALRKIDSKIYEENLNGSMKYEQNSDASPSNANKQEDSQGNNTHRSPSEMTSNFNQSQEDQANMVIDEKIVKMTEIDLDLKPDSNKNSVLDENEEEIYLALKFASNSNAVKEDIKQTKTDVELKSKDFIESKRDEEPTKQINAEEISEELNLEKDVSLPFSKKVIESKMVVSNADDKLIINSPNESLSEQILVSLDKSATELKSAVESLATDRNVHNENLDKTNVDESMLLVIDDPEYDSHQKVDSKEDALISNRNGDLSFSGIPHSGAKTADRRSDVHTVDLHERFEQQVRPGEIQTPKKPIKKVTVAEVMKQLKVLDVNGKLASFRMKSAKPNVKRMQRPPKNIPRKELTETLEKLQYLEKLRIMLYDHLQ